MNTNFTISGLSGDFIHSLYAMKNICNKNNIKGNLFVKDGHWNYGVEKAYNDLYSLVIQQSYVNEFQILSNQNISNIVDLSLWRNRWDGLNNETGIYYQCWSEILSDTYKFAIPDEYKWIYTGTNEIFKDKIVVHRSIHHHNTNFPWLEILSNLKEDILFLCTYNEREWDEFKFKNGNMQPYRASNFEEMAIIINSCKMFIGNQSSPFAMASALDVPRLGELDSHPSKFYMDENKYSENISWFLNDNLKYSSSNCMIKF